jgi:hypothetical protein
MPTRILDKGHEYDAALDLAWIEVEHADIDGVDYRTWHYALGGWWCRGEKPGFWMRMRLNRKLKQLRKETHDARKYDARSSSGPE